MGYPFFNHLNGWANEDDKKHRRLPAPKPKFDFSKIVPKQSRSQKMAFQAFMREEKAILQAEKKLNLNYEKSFEKLTKLFRGDRSRAVERMHSPYEGSPAWKFNQANALLMQRKKRNMERLHKLL